MAELTPKKKKKKWIIPVVIVGVLAVLIYFGATAIRESRLLVTSAQTRTAVAEPGTVELSVSGAGSLSADDSVDVEVPAILPVEKINVELGDVVKAGDVLATLDPAQLQNSISQVQDEIAAIDEKINESEGNTDESEITAPASGRVKEITVSEGGSIQDVMVRDGYLMVLSLDGKMKVEIEGAVNPDVGTDVVVVLPDGGEEDGKVVSTGASAFTVTLTDNGPAPGQAVSVQDEDGGALGSGTLEINAPLNIVGSNGTVKSVDAELDEKVNQGEALVTLSDTVAEQEYQELARDRIGYEGLLRTLLKYAETNTIVAELDGSITEIQGGQQSSGTDGSGGVDVSGILSSLPISADAGSGDGKVMMSTAIRVLSEAPTPEPTVTELVGVIALPVTQPALGGTPQATIQPGTGYTGTIAWEPAATFFGPQTMYTAIIMLQAEPGYRFADNIQVVVAGANIEAYAVSAEAERNTISLRAVFPPTAALPEGIDLESYINGILQNSLGGINDAVDSLGNIGGSFSIDSSAFDTSSLTGGASATTTSTSMTTLCTVTPGKVYSMVAEIDEVDIFSVELGQPAKVVMDAMLDDVFMGTVTKISTVGTSQSGVTTYPVTILLDVTDTPLLGGMNATGNIVTEVSENVLLIPLEALQERGDELYVYLYDSQNPVEQPTDGQALGEIRVVTTGISDGVNVEITSGLQEGDEVVYTVTESNAFLDAIMSMGGGPSGSSQGTAE